MGGILGSGSGDSGLGPRFRLMAGILVLVATPALAQYQVHQWANFEQGKIPEGSVKIGTAPEQTVQVVKLSDVSGMPADFAGGEGARETGKYALKLTADPKPPDFRTYTTGLAVGTILDRDQLGSAGRALYQADFYLPAEGPLPSLAVLAMEPPDKEGETGTVTHVKKAFYRFGLTKGKQLYFSSFFPGESNAAKYETDPQLLAELPRPGWHRFALVMEGADKILCYVDGRETSFSPITEPALRKLMVGVMLADNEGSYNAYVDNISIQVAEDAPSLPDSPYTEGWKVPPGSARERASRPATPPAKAAKPAPDARWMEPVAAWDRAQREKIPLLLYFYAPGLPGTQKMDEMFATNAAAGSFLGRHAAARIDVNQLQGGETAKQYGIYKVPTFIVIAPDGKSYKRSTPARDASWNDIVAELELK